MELLIELLSLLQTSINNVNILSLFLFCSFLPSSISGLIAVLRLLLVVVIVVVVCPRPCLAGDEPADTQLSATPQATPTPLWAVDWGPTQPLENETHHFLPSQEAEGVKQATPEAWPRHRNAQANHTRQHPLSIEAKDSGEEQERDAEEREIEEGGHLDGRLSCPLPTMPRFELPTHLGIGTWKVRMLVALKPSLNSSPAMALAEILHFSVLLLLCTCALSSVLLFIIYFCSLSL